MALMFAELLITSPEAVSDSFFQELQLHFDKNEILELCYFALYYNIPHRYASALHVDAPDHENLVHRSISEIYPGLQVKVNKAGGVKAAKKAAS